MTETQDNQNNDVNPKWADAFNRNLEKIASTLESGTRVIIQKDTVLPNPTTPEEAASYDRAIGTDWYRLDDNGKITQSEIKYRFAHWFPTFTCDQTVSNAFLAKASIEKWKSKPESTERFQGLRVIEPTEQREIIGQFFTDCREFFLKFTPTTRSILDQQQQSVPEVTTT